MESVQLYLKMLLRNKEVPPAFSVQSAIRACHLRGHIYNLEKQKFQVNICYEKIIRTIILSNNSQCILMLPSNIQCILLLRVKRMVIKVALEVFISVERRGKNGTVSKKCTHSLYTNTSKHQKTRRYNPRLQYLKIASSKIFQI